MATDTPQKYQEDQKLECTYTVQKWYCNTAQVARKMTGRNIHIMTAKTTRGKTVEKERAEAGWQSYEEVKTTAAKREKWKDSLEALCATRHEEDR